jgi:hypothetical protein
MIRRGNPQAFWFGAPVSRAVDGNINYSGPLGALARRAIPEPRMREDWRAFEVGVAYVETQQRREQEAVQ